MARAMRCTPLLILLVTQTPKASVMKKRYAVPISRILFLLKEGYTLEAIHEEYPHIPLETLSGAIDEVITVINQTLHAKKISQV